MNKMVKSFGWLFLVVGFIMLVVGGIFYFNDMGLKDKYIKTDAKIINIYKEKSSIDVEFYVERKRYFGGINYYNASMKVEGKVPVYYNPKDPNDFYYGGFMLANYIVLGVGGILAIVGFVLLAALSGNKKKYKKIKKYNCVIHAAIIKVRPNIDVYVKGKNPYVLEASYLNHIDGRHYYFKSENIWYDISLIIQRASIRTVPVYVNPKDFTEYYIDMEPILKYIEE